VVGTSPLCETLGARRSVEPEGARLPDADAIDDARDEVHEPTDPERHQPTPEWGTTTTTLTQSRRRVRPRWVARPHPPRSPRRRRSREEGRCRPWRTAARPPPASASSGAATLALAPTFTCQVAWFEAAHRANFASEANSTTSLRVDLVVT
jgi:hypothetical protein